MYCVPDEQKPALFLDNFGKCGPMSTILSRLVLVINAATSPHICCHISLWRKK